MDKGPWKVDVWHPSNKKDYRKIVLQSDDFEHDVALEITGDFADWDQKMAYAEWLASQLNAARESVNATGDQP